MRFRVAHCRVRKSVAPGESVRPVRAQWRRSTRYALGTLGLTAGAGIGSVFEKWTGSSSMRRTPRRTAEER
jgi:hypothetical protein